MLDQSLLAEIRTCLRQAFGSRLHGVVLYGSQARNEAGANSDIDLLVLLDEPIHLGADLKTIIDALYPLQLQCDRIIEALPVSWKSYEAGTFGLYRNAKREGLLL